MPFVSSRRALSEHRAQTQTDASLYFTAKGRHRGHYTPLGNAAVFPAILRGIAGEYD